MGKLGIFVILMFSVLCSGFHKTKVTITQYEVKSFYADLKTPVRTAPHGERDTMTFQYGSFLYFMQKDSVIDLEYFALFNADIFEFFLGEATYQPIENKRTDRLNEKEPIQIRYNGQYYPLKTDINLPQQSLPRHLYYASDNGFVYVLIEENILSMNPPTPVGYCYLLIKFKKNELVKQTQFYSADQVGLVKLMSKWPK